MEFLKGPDARREIAAQMQTSKRAHLAVAFWGSGAAETLGIAYRNSPVRVICNLAHGGTNPAEIRCLQALPGGHTIAQNDRLHAKVYLFDDVAIVGSSNASANGLSFEGREQSGWFEANILIRDDRVLGELANWFDNLGAHDILPVDLDNAQKAWDARRQAARGSGGKRQSLLDALVNDPHFFTGRTAHVALYDTMLDEEERLIQTEVQKAIGKRFGIFTKWPDLPRETPVVCFFVEDGIAHFDGVWRILPKSSDFGAEDIAERIQVAEKREEVFGLSPQSDAAGWRAVCKWVQRQPIWEASDHHVCLPLSEIASAIADGKLVLPAGKT